MFPLQRAIRVHFEATHIEAKLVEQNIYKDEVHEIFDTRYERVDGTVTWHEKSQMAIYKKGKVNTVEIYSKGHILGGYNYQNK